MPLRRRFLPQDLQVSVLAIVVIGLISSVGVDAQQTSTRSNRSGGLSGSSGAAGGTTNTVDDDDTLPEVNGSATVGNCTQCSIREVKRDYRLQAIKADILRKLRISNMPNVTGRRLPDIPQLQRIMETYTFQNDSPVDEDQMMRGNEVEVDDSYATTIKVIVFAQTAPPIFAGNSNNIFTFNFTADLANQQIVNATMGIFIRRPTNPSSLITTWILVYRVRPLPSQERVLVHRRRVLLNQLSNVGQWFTINMKHHVESSVSQVNTSIGYVVQASDGRGEPLAIVNPRTQEEEVLKPYLEIHVRDRGTSRAKRTIDLDCDENSAESRCCRYPLIVDFEQFRWDWVIVPKRYSAYYCSGECSFHYYQRYPHTNLAQQANRIAGTPAGGPCCSPRKVSAISMLYYDEYMNIVYGRLPGMVVDQCGCS